MFNSSSVEDIDWENVIPDNLAYNFAFWLGVVILNLLNFQGIVSNIVNVIVFIKQGWKERVRFTLLWLSIADLMGAVSQAAMTSGYLWDVQMGPILINGQSFQYFLWSIKALWNDLSSGLTMFISLERCICVVRPLHFNSSIIARHGKVIVIVIVVIYIVYYFPLITPERFQAVINVETNATLYYPVYPTFTHSFNQFNDYFLSIALCVLVPCLIFVCSILMLRGLQKSSRVRKIVSVQSVDPGPDSGLSSKERLVIKMIFILAWLYLFSSFPQFTSIVIYYYYDTFGSNARKLETKNLILIVQPLSFVIIGTYGAFSIFVYYFFSSSYRNTLNAMVSFRKFSRNYK